MGLYSELSRSLNEVVSFTNKHRINAEFNIHSVGNLTEKSELQAQCWATFEKRAGVYIIFNNKDNLTHYIGMSESDIGSRLFQWLYKENHVNDAVSKNDIVFTINLPQEQYMSRALEAFLIEKINPSLNKRRL